LRRMWAGSPRRTGRFLLRFERIDAVIQAYDQHDRLVKCPRDVSDHLHVVVNVPAEI